jgi:anthranilate/para-aminobenzoate synthase component I
MALKSRAALLTELQPPQDSHWMLCFSGMQSQNSGGRSLLAAKPAQIISGNRFAQLPQQGEWFGYVGYGMRCDGGTFKRHREAPLHLPDFTLFQPQQIQQWEHKADEAWGEAPPVPVCVDILNSNMLKDDYLRSVEATLEQIAAGNFYQANITRKFYGRFEQAPDSFALFKRFCALSPSPYAAYFQCGDTAILSSSPEGFLEAAADGTVIARPIKGSAPADTRTLEDSAKDRAENLMIVDLMRNDLSRVCEKDSVVVDALCEVHDFATIRQMISTIRGRRRSDAALNELLQATFPPGSMTGAPKIAAMHWCDAQEKMERGVYSGALGWLNADTQSCDLSVVIRTLIIRKDHFEFQVGGGIVADSTPEAEWEESLLKARAICRLLQLPESRLRSL